MWQFLVKAAIGSIIMKAKPIKKMVKRFMRGAVKKLGKTAGTLIGGAALMIMGGYATNGAYGFGKGFFGGVEGAKQAKSAFDLIGRAKDAFSTAGSEMSSFTEFLKGGIDKVKGSAETGTDLGTGVDTVDPIPAKSFNPETLLSDSTSELENIGRRLGDISERGSPDFLNLQQQQLAEMQKIADARNFSTASSDLTNIGSQMINEVPGTTAYQALQQQQLDAMNAMADIRNTYTSTTATEAGTSALEEIVVTAQKRDIPAKPWYQKTEEWMKENPNTTGLLASGLGLLTEQETPPQQDPMMMGIGGYTGYGTSQTEAWRAYAPEYVAYSVDNQLNPNSYINYMSALG